MHDRKVAVVTAAAGAGIGAAIARKLAEDGMTVVITDAHERRSADYAEKLAKEFDRPFSSHALDVTDFDAVARVMEKVESAYGRIDVLVNNAGWSKIEPVAETSRETWLKCIDVDLNGTFNCMRHALPSSRATRKTAPSSAAWATRATSPNWCPSSRAIRPATSPARSMG